MRIEPRSVSPPELGLFRLSHRGRGSFLPPDWQRADPIDGTFGNRFDDPETLSLPRDQCFRVIYCATQRICAFGETLARFRAPLSLLAQLSEIEDDEPLEQSLSGAIDAEHPDRMLVGADWRAQRVVCHTLLDPSLRFVDLAAIETIEHLREPMATQARDLGISDIDESAVLGPAREFTQAIARYFYEYGEPSDRTAFAGLRYTSRLNLEWECWALFADRIRHSPGMPGLPESIFPDDADLIEIARLWSLTIEGLCGSNALDRP